MNGLNQYFGKSGSDYFAYVSCVYCGNVVGKAVAQDDQDCAAMTDAVSEAKQHLLSCDKSPDHKPSEMDIWMKKALNR